MNKTPISIALERQIPEFIREDYGLFVKFIKAYYAFLEETQQRNLEDIRSVENTLDEFIIKFKKELAMVFPTNTLENERFILQRMQEFYMTRGSVESFQFLFRSIFNRDATVYYPSQQILRASDGKWTQETSVFVEQTSGDLDSLSGKIIKIITDKKHIDLFATKVIYYRDNVYEIFIDRRYTADIEIGDQVVFGSNVGSIIPCPSKYTIVQEGKGFTVGSIYNLPSEKGTGSTIKITKVGTNGEIKKIQIISFGLDYESNFYSKLSNKTRQAVPYYHPIRADDANKLLNPYEEPGIGYIDYGYINTQDYFYYDTNYTFVDSSNQYFYADGSYVGQIIGSFYTNATGNTIDEDTAEIKIDLGPIAVYPGFYQKSDGFISDEIYIQDGKYYQLFSYVIKVEEQLDKYKDIVLSLLHPAGLELFAEYTIRNDFVLSATPLLAFIRRQFLDSSFSADYAAQANNKIVEDFFAVTVLNAVIDIDKSFVDTFDANDYSFNDVLKTVDTIDSTVSLDFTRTNSIDILKLEDQNISENNTYLYTTGKAENTSALDYQWNDVTLEKNDSVTTPFTRLNLVESLKVEVANTLDDTNKRLNRENFDALNDITDSIVNVYGINKQNTVTSIDNYTTAFTARTNNETLSLIDNYSSVTTLETRQEIISTTDDLIEFGLSGASWTDTLTPSHSALILGLSGASWRDTFVAIDNIESVNEPALKVDNVSTSDSVTKTNTFLRLFADSVTSFEEFTFGYLLSEDPTILDQYSPLVSYSRSILDTNALSDQLFRVYLKTHNDNVPAIDGAILFGLSGASWTDLSSTSDNILTVRNYARQPTDFAPAIDSSLSLGLSGASWTDLSSTSDNILTVRNYVRSESDTSSQTDSISLFQISGATFNKTVTTNENVNRTITYIRSFGDSISLADYAAFGYLYSDPIQSPIDSITIGASYVRLFNDNTQPSHSGLFLGISGSTFRDIISQTDSIGLLSLSGATFADTPIASHAGIDFAISGSTFREGINNSNTGLLYINPYNQDNESTFFTYFSESYTVIDSRALT
jgi:hypothetical protein